MTPAQVTADAFFLTADDITDVIKIAFDCRPGTIAQPLALREPKYQETAEHCHFGRDACTKDGIKSFEWEKAKVLSKVRRRRPYR